MSAPQGIPLRAREVLSILDRGSVTISTHQALSVGESLFVQGRYHPAGRLGAETRCRAPSAG